MHLPDYEPDHPPAFKRFMERIGDMNEVASKVYISGPMTDCPGYNFDNFEKAAELIEAGGDVSVSPADMTGVKEGWEWEDYLREDLRLILDCDAIVLLPGWKESRGARLEYDTAKRLGLKMAEFDEDWNLTDHDPDDDESAPTILEEAQRLVWGPREATYGHPHLDFSRTAKLWSVVLETDVTPGQAALCMLQVKVSRLLNSYKRDSVVDLAGYAAVYDRIQTYEEG